MKHVLLFVIAIICLSAVAEPLDLGAKSDLINTDLGLVAKKYNEFVDYNRHICMCGKLASLPKLPKEQRLVIGKRQTNGDEHLYVVFSDDDLQSLGTCPNNNSLKYYTVLKDSIAGRE